MSWAFSTLWLSIFSAGPVKDPRDWAEIFSAQLRSYPCHPSSTMTEFFKIWSKNYQAFLFSYVIEVWFNLSIGHTLIWKSKNVDFSMIFCIWIWFAKLWGKSVFWFLDKFYLFWPKCVAAAQLIFSRVEWYWIEVFEPSKKAQILNCSKIFNFIHDRHIFLALLVK